jgi:hypothetical protein
MGSFVFNSNNTLNLMQGSIIEFLTEGLKDYSMDPRKPQSQEFKEITEEIKDFSKLSYIDKVDYLFDKFTVRDVIDTMECNYGSFDLMKNIGFFKVLLIKANETEEAASKVTDLVDALNTEYADFNLDLNAKMLTISSSINNHNKISKKDTCCNTTTVCCCGILTILTCNKCKVFKGCCEPFCEGLFACLCFSLEILATALENTDCGD